MTYNKPCPFKCILYRENLVEEHFRKQVCGGGVKTNPVYAGCPYSLAIYQIKKRVEDLIETLRKANLSGIQDIKDEEIVKDISAKLLEK